MDQRIENRAAGINRTQAPAKMVSGTPPMTPGTRGFKNTRDFQQRLIDVRTDESKTARQRQDAENELVARRRRQLGE